MKVQYPDAGEFDLLVSPVSLDDYDEIDRLLGEALERFRPSNVRALATKLAEVAKPAVDGEPAEIGKLDPNLILSLAIQWLKGVRGVPLPLPVRPSDTETSEATPAL